MRTLKLQMQLTIDGFVADPDGEVDWMVEPDPRLWKLENQFVDTSDTILMGRKMTPGFVNYWESVKPDSKEYSFARKMVETPKVVFSRTVDRMEGENVRVERDDLVTAVTRLKEMPGKDLLVYGGGGLVGSLIDHGLIDQLNLFVHPVAIGRGMPLFTDLKQFTLTGSDAYPCGVVVNSYQPA